MSCNLSVSETELVNIALAAHVRSLRKEYEVAMREHHPEGWKFAKRLFDAEVLWRRIDGEIYAKACIAYGKIDPEYAGF
jgi:hypothetical protein